MKSILLTAACLLVTASVSAAMLPGDAATGKNLHDKQCVACHTTSVYTRANRNVKTVEGLIGQVNMCKEQLNIKLGKDQVNDLVKYLDETFYKFP